ncbi:hydrolase TatD [bacterium (Candidatus Blackallbacteria) CG17_big_fil_post_rev_8_21_14_2_50_48_46]|uniref:Hydrolase TatD n=1 Tax=bacterium (Candidatus Blackallbacteria) CG17_big_fil_post_rev_8_21_14_2_50_48_46 TaxID=2014261 RepID=A0A2M7G2Q7_9BACT|nr:MAG: hydrolase TatD [bacterium (Candidatus Blackallbacteria) CG18_big_fil_WC_8_21_14_2_50_49_26]PIW16123.1 MAG: hydrolase TatD [bacterium (Candidatus Blackallbacteria) CG17_big_fil_post_rev_8_21_14_2_50_48_46]PIW45772.1 MAG: hydrolase TatD [bacterium (Candidatus Blackallbacteria) CG13_big_fil_rev_8_21_14_2_50_49_14]
MSSDLPLIDTHTHLNLSDYQADQNEVIQKALDEGLIRMLLPGVTLESCLSAIELSRQYPALIYCGLGIHPQDVAGWDDAVEARFLEMAKAPEVVAIGETGLDYYWDSSPPELQHSVLRRHIHLARELQLPLILHVRDKADSQAAYQDLLRILKQENAQEIGGVMHCFSGDLAFAQASIDLNFYLAFGGVLTFRNAQNLQAVAAQIDLQHIVLETDSPWLAPVPYRGKRNEPAYIRHVAEKLAEIKQCSLEEISQITTENARHLFQF